MTATQFSNPILLLCLAFTLFLESASVAQDKQQNPAEIENQVFGLLKDQKVSAALELRSQLEQAKSSADSNSFSILDNRLTWTIPGKCDASRLFGSIEYLVGTDAKSYEAILIVDEDQIARVHKIADTVKAIQQNHLGTIQIQIVWTQDEQLRIWDLSELFRNANQDLINEFLIQARKSDFGWKSTHLEADQRRWPTTETDSMLIVSFFVDRHAIKPIGPESPSPNNRNNQPK